ncbi:MAG: hypothetical protein V3V08_23425 [Nannocystaceae bacterium]
MSYCRWSTDDFQCDLYIYEDVAGGWTIHVAGNRVLFTEELPPPVSMFEAGWVERHSLVMEWLGDETKHHRVDIELPHAGECFSEPTPAAAADRCEELKALGYQFPEYVIPDLLS